MPVGHATAAINMRWWQDDGGIVPNERRGATKPPTSVQPLSISPRGACSPTTNAALEYIACSLVAGSGFSGIGYGFALPWRINRIKI